MNQDIVNIVKKGTTTVGIMCKDGIVMAADKRAVLGMSIIGDKKVDKVFKIADNIAVTIAGTVSDAQLITKLIKAELRLKKVRTGKNSSIKETANLLGTIVYQNIRKFSPILGITGFLLGGSDNTGFRLYEIGPDGSVLEQDEYTTDGSGMVMAFGVLDTLYKKDMSIADGIKLAVKAINAAMQRDTATGEGIDVYTITKEGIKKVLTKKIDTTISI
jgi:proteasome beta subunit